MSEAVQPWYAQPPSLQAGPYNPNVQEPQGTEDPEGLSTVQREQLIAAQGGLPNQAAGPGGQPAQANNAPPLPDVEGTRASEQVAAQRGNNWKSLDDSNSVPITSLAMAFDVLVDCAAETMLQNGKLKNLFNQDQVAALKASAEDQIDQVKGERQSAANKLIGACVATVAVAGLGWVGARFNFGGATSKTAGIGAAVGGAGGAVTTLINSATTYFDTCMPGGGQHSADEAKIRKAIQDIFVQLYKSQEDNFNNNYENNRKAVQSVLDMKRAVDDNSNQVNLSIAQNV